jgi:hypothetical protein
LFSPFVVGIALRSNDLQLPGLPLWTWAAVPGVAGVGEPVAAGAGSRRPEGPGHERRGRGQVQAFPGPAGRAGGARHGRDRHETCHHSPRDRRNAPRPHPCSTTRLLRVIRHEHGTSFTVSPGREPGQLPHIYRCEPDAIPQSTSRRVMPAFPRRPLRVTCPRLATPWSPVTARGHSKLTLMN